MRIVNYLLISAFLVVLVGCDKKPSPIPEPIPTPPPISPPESRLFTIKGRVVKLDCEIKPGQSLLPEDKKLLELAVELADNQ